MKRTRPLVVVACCALIGTGALVAPAAAAHPAAAHPTAAEPPAAEQVPAVNYAAEVNPFVGTESEGNAYPGATLPFGMVQLSPDNTNTYASTSYSKNAQRAWGFSHRHINSAGCPAAGEILVTPTISAAPRTARAYTNFKAGTERAEAGYYDVTLNSTAPVGEVRAELTATTRTGEHRYTFPATTTANLSFNVGQTLNSAGASSVTWVDATTLEGYAEGGGFCGSTAKQRVYFSATFDRAPTGVGTWTGSTYTAGRMTNTVTAGGNGAVATFDTTADRDVEVSLGMSFVSVDGARANRVAEATDDGAQVSFDTIRARAREAWNAELGRIAIDASAEQRVVFYTQLYKTLISPTIGSDVDGRYFGMDQAVHKAEGDRPYYQTFSLWDTYRTQAALQALLVPERTRDIVRSMYAHRVEGGWLPRWSLGAIETNVMAGDPVTPWLAENFALGTVPADIADGLWADLIENATTTPPATVASVGRRSAEFYRANGHVPFYGELEGGLGAQFEEYRHAGSATLELAQADASIGAAAARTGRFDDVESFLAKGRNWRNLWNPAVTTTGGFKGVVNAKRPTGAFQTVADTASVLTSGFHEGVAFQYQWMVPQDVTGLQEVMGGRDGFIQRLDYYFDLPQLVAAPGVSPNTWARGGSSYYTTVRYNPGNEPTIMNAWLYNNVGQPWKTNDVLAANLNRFPNTPANGVGNDDLGTLSAWYVMASLGFQPVMPGTGILALNAPKVQAATIRPEGSDRAFTITAAGANEKLPSYIRGVTLNGRAQTATWYDASAIQNGGSIVFDLVDSSAGLTWGTAAADLLPSVSEQPPAFTAAGAVRCLAGKGYLSVSLTNGSTVPVDVVLDTPYGSQTVPALGAGRTAYQSYPTRLAAVPAGKAVATITWGAERTTSRVFDYPATTCG